MKNTQQRHVYIGQALKILIKNTCIYYDVMIYTDINKS